LVIRLAQRVQEVPGVQRVQDKGFRRFPVTTVKNAFTCNGRNYNLKDLNANSVWCLGMVLSLACFLGNNPIIDLGAVVRSLLSG